MNGIRVSIVPPYELGEDDSDFGLYKPGSVMKHKCPNGFVVVPVNSATRLVDFIF